MLVVLSAPVDSLPETARAPLQAPDAAQFVALALVHASVELAPWAMDPGVAVICMVGAGGGGAACTLTLIVLRTAPPGPEQFSVKALSVSSAPELALPAGARLPDQAPDATQDVASVVLHVSVVFWPDATDVGAAANVSVGAGVATVTDTL
jgi:hypothetical protein